MYRGAVAEVETAGMSLLPGHDRKDGVSPGRMPTIETAQRVRHKMTEPSSHKILGFNGLRGLCVIAVYLSHKCELRFYIAAMGVWAFLALSGFLIVTELHKARIEMEEGRYGVGTALRTFATKRALRIFPAYYALLVLLFLGRHFYAWAGPDLGFRWHFVYLSNVFFGWLAPWTGGPFPVLWTLSVEQQFYVIAAAAYLLVPSRFHVTMCLVMAVLAMIGHVTMQAFGAGELAVYMTSPWNFALIALGGAAGIRSRDPAWRQKLEGRVPLLVSLAVLVAFGATWLWEPTQDPVGNVTTFIAGVALVAIVAWIRANQASGVVRFLEWRPLEYLGVISYTFYLVHNFVPNPMGRLLPLYFHVEAPRIVTMTLGAALGFCISVTIAHLSWRYYEKPLLGLRARLLPRSASRHERQGPVEAGA
jgi:peptidoglycan/LPS O-acetylase OafA/YrhL